MKKILLLTGLIISGLCGMAQYSAVRIDKKGSGDPVIYLPGFTSPGSVWHQTAVNLDHKHTHYFVSYAGFNGLPAIKMPWYETLKKELISFIKNEHLKGIILIGHSMGGTLALDIAAEHPDLVKDLVIVDALPCMREVMMPGVSAEQLQYESPYNTRMLQMSDEAFAQTASMMAQGMTNNREKIDTLIRWSQIADRETFVYGYTDLLKVDLRKAIGQIKARTLILAAPFPTREMVQATLTKQYEALAAKEIDIASDSRHFIMFDQPEWLYKKVNGFLYQND